MDWSVVQAFLRSRILKPLCPMCGDPDGGWRLYDEGRAVTLKRVDDRNKEVGSFQAFAFACANCGFLRLHSPQVIEAELARAGLDGPQAETGP